MIKSVLQNKELSQLVTLDEEYGEFCMSAAEWANLKELLVILEPFKKATQYMSRSAYLSLPNVFLLLEFCWRAF